MHRDVIESFGRIVVPRCDQLLHGLEIEAVRDILHLVERALSVKWGDFLPGGLRNAKDMIA